MSHIQIAGIIILVIFYGVYFFKTISQRRSGIQNQPDKGSRNFSTAHNERTLNRTILSIAVIQLCSLFIDDPNMVIGSTNTTVQLVGLSIAVLSAIIFFIAITAIGNNWRIKNDDQMELVTNGIYRLSRNPAFLGLDLLYIGITTAFPNWILLIVSCMGIVMMHFQTIEEERHLSAIFGDSYASYKKQTPRYFLFF